MKVLILIALFAFASAEIRKSTVYDRPCSERSAIVRPQVKTAFNVAAYSGTWYELWRYDQDIEAQADCFVSSYSWGFISRSFTIFRNGIDFANNNTQINLQANALLAFPGASNAEQVGLLNVTYYADREADETNYYILATDYFQYAVGWGCESLENNQSREYAWILSRTPTLPEAYIERIDDYIERFFDRDLLRVTDQDLQNCFGDPSTEARIKFANAMNKV